MLKIIMQKAGNGDCIFLETQSEFVMIDGGTAQSFNNWKSHVLKKNKIDSLIVTHIDNDHVNGVIKLLQHDDCPEIGRFYFNGAEQLFGRLEETDNGNRMLDFKLRAVYEESSTAGSRDKIGCSEGTSLSYLLNRKNIICNDELDGEALCLEKCRSFNVGSMNFSVIGPEWAVLQDLKSCWEEKLNERRIKPKLISRVYCAAFEQYANSLKFVAPNTNYIAAYSATSIESLANANFEDDSSPTNKSSFSFLIECNEKRMLYLGDCHAEAVISWLNNIGVRRIEVDAVKISHHGSKNNTSLELLDRIVCNKYLISTDGNSHGHPDLETLARIAVSKKNSGAEVFFNYELDHIPEWFSDQLETSYRNVKFYMNFCEVDL